MHIGGCDVAPGTSDREKKTQNTQRESRMKVERKLTKNLPAFDEKSTKIDEKLMKFRSWAILDAQGRLKDALGRAPDDSETPRGRPKADLRTPWATQERLGVVQKRPRPGPETHPGRTEALPKRVRHTRQR